MYHTISGEFSLPTESSEMLTCEDRVIESIGLHVFDDVIQCLTEAEGVKPTGLHMRSTPNFQPFDSPVHCPERVFVRFIAMTEIIDFDPILDRPANAECMQQ